MKKVINATVDAILKEDLSEESAIQRSVYAGAVADVTMQALEEGLAAATVETVHAAIEASESKQTLEGEDVRQRVLSRQEVRRLHSLVSHLVEFAERMSASAVEFYQAEEQAQEQAQEESNNRYN